MAHKQQWKSAYPVDQLTEHPDNPRRGDVDAISESIDAHGFYGAVLVQQSSGHVIAGNHRLQAAKDRGLTKVPAILMDVDDDEARRILLADNRTSDMGGHDDAVLLGLLRELDGLAGTGYTDDFVVMLARVVDEPTDWSGSIGALPDGDRDPFQQMTFTLHDDQVEQVQAALDVAFSMGEFDSPNTNRNGNALARVCESFVKVAH